MKIHPRCYPCQIKRVMSELRLCNLPREEELAISREMLLYYASNNELRSSWLGTGARRELARLTGIKDPYASLKKRANNFALQNIEILKNFVYRHNGKEDLFIRAALGSVIGNLMEFFLSEHNFELKFPKPLDLLLETEKFTHTSIESLKNTFKILSKSKKLLFLPDNAGEIVFDKIFLEVIKEIFPQIEIYVAVKPSPIINDATMEDALEAKLNEIEDLHIITTGIASIGLFIDETSPEFRKIWNDSDFTILKGMGHVETRDELGIPTHGPRLYLFRVKCSTVAELINEKIGANIALLDKVKGGKS